MALSTLANVKLSLGIATSDTSQDTALTLWLAQASALIRAETGQFLGGVIGTATLANPTVCTSPGHGLETGDVIYVSHSNTTPTIDGERTVTRVDRDTFTVPVNVSVAGTFATYARQFIEFYEGDGTNLLLLRQRPVKSITSIYEDNAAYYGDASGAFAAATLLTAGTDYVLQRNAQTGGLQASFSGGVWRIAGAWPPTLYTGGGLLTDSYGVGLGNIKATYFAGFGNIPDDLQLALAMTIALVRNAASQGDLLESESLDYYSYTRGGASSSDVTERSVIGIKRILARYKEPVV